MSEPNVGGDTASGAGTIPPPRVIVNDVTKTFQLRTAHSMKEAFVARVKRQQTGRRFDALKGVSVTVEDGESVAILGLNGSGKSTLLKLISGVLSPDAGEVLVRGRLAGLIEVGAGFHPDLTGRENVYLNAAILGMQKSEIDAVFDEIVAFADIGPFIDNDVKRYSSGMYLRLAFAVAIHVPLDVMLVDEVLAVGDPPFRQKCRDRIRSMSASGCTMVIVSHSTSEVLELCTRGVVLRRGVVVFDGPIDGAVEAMSRA
ncbi:MAG TPA: ABC transporter ATP-binding protein [Humibacter sp.]|nr:ABC transporter ATP-binding protein [Humibacter sp.]